ncbi:hypothetical protein [Nocardiopsis algeriensis]|uniref:Uncharacterized protein n=1 Tax=Nocardiopsis algeriensis TaxID=1478215 RepID=A0A841IS37_9ACTN|nr:hypothetical protein [Nocardiopsis algeriensis]MBB6121074.1 hypothetical protein [Nocardiopsis algeriensis]
MPYLIIFLMLSFLFLCLSVFMEGRAISKAGGDMSSGGFSERVLLILGFIRLPYSFPRWWLSISLVVGVPALLRYFWDEAFLWIPWIVISAGVFLVSAPSFSASDIEEKRANVRLGEK